MTESRKEAGMEEQELIRRAQAGDATAFSDLLDLYYDTIFRFAWKWCRHRVNAEDIAQLACIKLASSLAQYRFQAAFASWLYRLVISCAQDWQRSQRRHDHDEYGASVEPHTDGTQPEDQIYLLQLLGELEDLGEGMKETALLVHAEGMSHAEAGAILGVSESTVSWRIHTIRRHMGKREARASESV
jgi:RNA polymerase sigma-70 factor (ECF subfamily)